VIDGAYAAMHRAITADQTPNMFFLHYKLPQLTVESVLLIPRFAFSLSCVEKRKPLSPKAVRAGYVGCYFVLDRIPPDARIPIVQNARPVSSSQVRRAYKKIRSLETMKGEKRGWTLDVLNLVRSLEKETFTLRDLYDRADSLARLHPQNRHINDKIRQQLQVLRDLSFLEFLGDGSYRLR
jgi:type II restriction enzyme